MHRARMVCIYMYVCMYVYSSLLPAVYTPSFLDYIHEATHLLTLLTYINLLTLQYIYICIYIYIYIGRVLHMYVCIYIDMNTYGGHNT